MLCNNCHEHEAVIHIQEIVGQSASSIHLCRDCAASQGLIPEKGQELDLSSMVSSLTAKAFGAAQLVAEPEAASSPPLPDCACESCGLTSADFHQTGRLGCSCCYDVFSEYLARTLSDMHRGNCHTGKSPDGAENSTPRVRLPDVLTLRKELHRAVSSEAYEKAAELRDRIEQLVGAQKGC